MWIFIQENDKRGQVIQISAFRSPRGFEVSTPEIVGPKIVLIVLTLIFIGSLLGARYYSEFFTLTHFVFKTIPRDLYRN